LAKSPEETAAHTPVQKDKRSTLRTPLIVERIPCDDGRKTFFGYARNLSRGGVFIPTVSPREPREQFELHMTLPASAGFTLSCRCEVVWRRRFERQARHEPGMGLRFLDLPAETADALERWLATLPQQP
jgi:uncharacterized protein (TIGR02266 family)